jgi:hypothetical protein
MVRQAQVDRGLLQEALTQQPSALVDNDAANKAGDADLALQDLGGDAVAYAYVTASLVVWDEDPAIADAKLALAEKVIQGRDFTVIKRADQRGRGLARDASRARPTPMSASRRSRPEPGPHDAPVGGVGGAAIVTRTWAGRRC